MFSSSLLSTFFFSLLPIRYSMLLLALGILHMLYSNYITLLAEIIITCLHQVGMLCMGVGMSVGITQISWRSRTKSELNDSRGSRDGNSRFSKNRSALFNNGLSKKSSFTSRNNKFQRSAGKVPTPPVPITLDVKSAVSLNRDSKISVQISGVVVERRVLSEQ